MHDGGLSVYGQGDTVHRRESTGCSAGVSIMVWGSGMTVDTRLATNGIDTPLVPPWPQAWHSGWRATFASRLLVTDLVVLAAVIFGTQVAWFGSGNAEVAMRDDSHLTPFSYWAFSGGLLVVWMWVLSLADTRSHRIVGSGATEYVRIIASSVQLFGIIAIIAFLTRVDLARGFLLISLPAGLLLLVTERWWWRGWLVRQRSRGAFCARVLLVGSPTSVAQIAANLQRDSSAGYVVVGACLPHRDHGDHHDAVGGVRVLGSLDDIAAAMDATGADTVAVTSTGGISPRRLKEISWGLESGDKHLILAPALVDIAGPRIHARPVAGLPFIHVETPRFSRGQTVAKRVADVLGAGCMVVLLSPLLVALALVVRFTSPGPVIFRQPRVGWQGHEFTMLKFRSMVQNAEDLLADLQQQQREAGNSIMFKMRDDPRMTPAGRVMRKYSLDELPQLFNVLGGSMSLVGPRPPLMREVEQYEKHVHRRFLVKPGITGLWQVSGRSTLSWEETVRLDLSYVENWTLLGDVLILLKTVKAALRPGNTAA